jgi:2-(1,2-epoxy-1,2-dihydrophenyl)acetyl-CoA isomerase
MTQAAPQTASEPVLTHLENGVFTITMNRPESLNSANTAMLKGMQNALSSAERDENVRAIVVTGAGRGFCSGADLKEHGTGINFKEHLDHTFNPVVLKMRTLEKPVICAVNGIAAGAGASIALAGDIRVWSSDASFMEAFSKIALIPDAGSTWLLPQLVGYHRAFDLCVHAEKVGPDDALKMGLCERVYPAEEFLDRVKALAENLAAGPTKSFGLTKRAMNKNMTASFADALEYEGQIQDIAGASPDFREGVGAFLEKRQAKFSGK